MILTISTGVRLIKMTTLNFFRDMDKDHQNKSEDIPRSSKGRKTNDKAVH